MSKNGPGIEFDVELMLDTAMKTVDQMGKHITRKMKASWTEVNSMVDLFQNALGKADALMKQMVDTAKTDARARYFKINTSDAKAYQKALGDTVTQLDALKEANRLVSTGLDKKDLAMVGELTRAMEFYGGVTKQAAQDVIANGQASEEILQVFKTSQIELDAAMASAQTKLGRELTLQERRKVLINELSRGYRKLGNVANKDVASPIERLNVALKDASQKFVKEFSIALLGAHKNAKGARIEMDGINTLAKSAGWFVGKIAAGWGSIIELMKEGHRTYKEVRYLYSDEYTSRQKSTKAVKKQVAVQKALTKTVKKTDEARRRALEAARRRRKQYLAMLKKERLEEIQGMRQEARALTRNFQGGIFDAFGATGGTFGTILSAMKDTFEFGRTLRTEYGSTLRKTSDMALADILKMRKVSGSRLKAAILFNERRRAGLLDQREFITNEKIVLTQLRASLETSAAQQKIAAARVELLNNEKDVKASLESINRLLLIMEDKRFRFAKGEVNRLRKARAEYIAINKAKKSALQLTIQLAEIEKVSESKRARLTRARALRDEQQKLLDIQRETMKLRLREKRDPGLDSRRRVAALREEMQQAKIKADELYNKLMTLGGSAAQRQRWSDELAHNEKMLGLKKQLIVAEKERGAAAVWSASKEGKAAAKRKVLADQAKRQIEQLKKSMPVKAVQSMTGAIAGMFEGLVSGSKDWASQLGKSALDAIGTMAIEMGTMLMLSGLGFQAVPPFTGGAAVVAGGALIAMGGGAKGAGALMAGSGEASATSGSSLGSSFTAPPMTGIVGQDSAAIAGPNVVYMQIVSPLWFGSEEEQARKHRDMLRRNRHIVDDVFDNRGAY